MIGTMNYLILIVASVTYRSRFFLMEVKMANLADANGRAYVDYEIYELDPKLFETFWNQLNAKQLDEYGIFITSFNENEIEFQGTGRWTMGNTIEGILDPEELSVLPQVASKIKENKGLLHFEYDEYEPGSEILRAVELAFSFDQASKPIVVEETMDDYPYSKEIIESLGFMPLDELDF